MISLRLHTIKQQLAHEQFSFGNIFIACAYIPCRKMLHFVNDKYTVYCKLAAFYYITDHNGNHTVMRTMTVRRWISGENQQRDENRKGMIVCGSGRGAGCLGGEMHRERL